MKAKWQSKFKKTPTLRLICSKKLTWSTAVQLYFVWLAKIGTNATLGTNLLQYNFLERKKLCKIFYFAQEHVVYKATVTTGCKDSAKCEQKKPSQTYKDLKNMTLAFLFPVFNFFFVNIVDLLQLNVELFHQLCQLVSQVVSKIREKNCNENQDSPAHKPPPSWSKNTFESGRLLIFLWSKPSNKATGIRAHESVWQACIKPKITFKQTSKAGFEPKICWSTGLKWNETASEEDWSKLQNFCFSVTPSLDNNAHTAYCIESYPVYHQVAMQVSSNSQWKCRLYWGWGAKGKFHRI